jgi:DNA-binding transcriptional ArsR family regulator
MITDLSDNALFKALAHQTRRAILDALRAGPRTTGDLCTMLADIDRCTVMQHLTVLVSAGLVIPERRSRERWNHLNALPIQHIHERWIGAYASHDASKLAHLDATFASASQTGAESGTITPGRHRR